MKRNAASLVPVLLLTSALFAQQVEVRFNQRLSSATARSGQSFQGELARPATIAGRSCAKGSPARGQVTEAKSSGRLKTPGLLVMELTSVNCGGRNLAVSSDSVRLEGRSHTKRNTVLIGGGTAAGAIIGGLAGGGKGALIGGIIGAGAGTAGAAATGKHEAVIEPEAIVAWNLNSAGVADARRSQRESSDSYRPNRRGDNYTRNDGDDDIDNDNDNGYGEDNDNDRGGGRNGDYRVFSNRDRNVISDCLSSGRSGLPPGLAKRDRLPPGLERQVQRNGTLPPGLQKKVTGLPGECSVGLPRLPARWERVILGSRVLLLDPARRIVDLFYWSR